MVGAPKAGKMVGLLLAKKVQKPMTKKDGARTTNLQESESADIVSRGSDFPRVRTPLCGTHHL